MKRLGLVSLVLLAAVAFAGSQHASYPANAGGPAESASASLGVDLGYKTGCRCILYVDAGTDWTGHDGFDDTGYVVPYFYEPKSLWVESASSLHCSVAAKLDGGKIRQVVCPDIPVAARTGRILCTGYGIKGADGGTGADLISDAGIGPAPVVRTQCWGANASNDGL